MGQPSDPLIHAHALSKNPSLPRVRRGFAGLLVIYYLRRIQKNTPCFLSFHMHPDTDPRRRHAKVLFTNQPRFACYLLHRGRGRNGVYVPGYKLTPPPVSKYAPKPCTGTRYLLSIWVECCCPCTTRFLTKKRSKIGRGTPAG